MGAKGHEKQERSSSPSPPPPPPPLFLSASLNSPSLIQLPGRRDSACSNCFTLHGPPSLSGSPLLRFSIQICFFHLVQLLHSCHLSDQSSLLKCFAKAGKMEPNQLFNGFGPLQPAVAVH